MSLLSTGVSGLLAFQRSLAVTGNNIANVNTDGYSRQRVELSSRQPQFTGAGYVGSGVDVTGIERIYDQFLGNQVRSSTSAVASLDSYYRFAAQLDSMLADPNVGLNPALSSFFDATQVVANDPDSVPARQVMLTESEILVSTFNELGRSINDMRDRVNSELRAAVGEINGLAQSLATLNQNIVVASGLGAAPNDLLDQRDALIGRIADLVDVTVIDQDDGAQNVFIGSGQALVVGSTVSTLSVQNGGYEATTVGLHMTTGTGSVDITSSLAGGQIGGLLEFRDEVLNKAQNSLGRISLGLAADVNAQHALGVDQNGQYGATYFLSGGPAVLPHTNNVGGAVTASLVDTDNLTTDDYLLSFDGGNAYTLLNLTTKTATAINTGGVSPFTTAEIDGFSIEITAGAAAGDTFLIQPTRSGASDIAFALTSPDQFAAAAPLKSAEATNANGVPLNTGTGAITLPQVSSTTGLPLGVGGDITLTFNANAVGIGRPGFVLSGGLGGSIPYDPATESAGKTFTLAGIGGATFSISGVPVVGDAFVITDNLDGLGDNRNMLDMSALQTVTNLLGGTASYQDAYGSTVSDVGTRTSRASLNLQSQQALLNQALQERESVSGVNLDEEAANLLIFQTAYQAAAQVIATSNTLFQTLLNSFQR